VRRKSIAAALSLLAVFAALFGACGDASRPIVIGSKNFTEQSVLGELLAQRIEAATRQPVERRFYLAGSYICHQAILSGRIDAYVEYTGTALTAILKAPASASREDVYRRVRDEYARRFDLEVFPPLGFNNTFAMIVRGDDARRLKLSSLSQIAPLAPQWRLGVGYEFIERPDGYQGLARTYGLTFREAPRLMDLGLIYRALKDKQVDIVAGNATDGLIASLDLAVLADDRNYFPPYEAVTVARRETLRRVPELAGALRALVGRISDDDMRRMNYAVDGERREVRDVVLEFLRSHAN
jgi:osmoprotectant transport system substrate-binding protein